MVDNSTLAVPLEPVDVLHPALGHGRDRGPETGRDVDPAVEGLGPEAGVHLAPEPSGNPSVDRPGEPAPVLPEVPVEEGLLAGRPTLAGEAPLLQLPDQGLDALARTLQLLGGLLVRLRVGADLLEEVPPLGPDQVERDPLAIGLRLEAIELALPRLQPRLRVLDLPAARLGQEYLAPVLLGDASQIVRAGDEIAEGARGEEVLEVGAPAALVDLAEPPCEAAPVGLELRGRSHELGGGVA